MGLPGRHISEHGKDTHRGKNAVSPYLLYEPKNAGGMPYGEAYPNSLWQASGKLRLLERILLAWPRRKSIISFGQCITHI